MKHQEMRNTVFGEVLARMMEERGLEVAPVAVGLFAEERGLDGWQVINRMARADAEDIEGLSRLAEALELTDAEKLELAYTYTYDERHLERLKV